MTLDFFLGVGLLGLSILTAFVVLMMSRLVRKQRSLEKRLQHVRAEVDQLLQAEERRAMAEAKSNKAFLSELSLRKVDRGATVPETLEEPKTARDAGEVSDSNGRFLPARSR